MTPEQMLREFHTEKGVGRSPARPTMDVPAYLETLRLHMLLEEFREFTEAVESKDIVALADALGDIVYVAVGTAVEYGIPFDEVFREIHRSNMTKDRSPTDGKLVKGPEYSPPRIKRILGETAAENEGDG